MCEVTGVTYVRGEAEEFPSIIDLHRIANKNDMVLADVEAKILLKRIVRETEISSLSKPLLEKLFLQLCYEHLWPNVVL